MTKRFEKEFVFHGLGFPVALKNVPMIKLDGEWVPDVNYDQIEDAMAIAVALKPARLTGDEVRFVRLRYGLSPREFAELFEYTRPGILKWEACGNKPTGMNWSTEKDLRLHVLARENLKPTLFRKVYDLFKNVSDRMTRHHFDLQTVTHKDRLVQQCVSNLSQ